MTMLLVKNAPLDILRTPQLMGINVQEYLFMGVLFSFMNMAYL